MALTILLLLFDGLWDNQTPMPEAKYKEIRIDQALHGYEDGHRLVQTSKKITRDTEHKMLILSDMSGSTMQQGFESYFTGYPIEEENVYAFAQTWYAPEMKRPGCVWTHTLLINNSDLGQIRDFRSLKILFSRPKEPLSKSNCKTPISFPLASSKTNRMGGTSEATVGQLLSALYNSPEKSVFIPSASANDFVDLVLAIWSQQWPKLRRSFRFCTGSLSNRSSKGNIFDLQVIPVDLVRQILREVPSAVIVNPDKSLAWNRAPLWLRVATQDLLEDNDKSLRKFLWSFGADVSGGRFSFSHLVDVYSLIDSIKLDNVSIKNLINTIAVGFPQANEAAHLKTEIFSGFAKGEENFFSKDMRVNLLRTILTTEKYKPFQLKDNAVAQYATRIWESDPEQAKELTLNLFSSNLNPLGVSFLSRMIGSISLEKAHDIFKLNPSVVPIIISQNPTLATIPQLWANSFGKQTELLDAVLASSFISEETINAIIDAMLKVDAHEIVRETIKCFGQKGVWSFLEWVNNKEQNQEVHPEVQQALASNPSALVDWLCRTPKPKASTIVLILNLLDPNSPEIQKLGEKIWLQLTSLPKDYFDKNALIKAMGFLLTIGFKNQIRHSEDLFAFSFEYVHDAAAEGALKYETWRLLNGELPSSPWWGDWDKCERLRLGLIERFLEDNWRPTYFLKAVKNPETFSQLVSILKKSENGRKFLKRLSYPISQNEIEATPSQLKILEGI